MPGIHSSGRSGTGKALRGDREAPSLFRAEVELGASGHIGPFSLSTSRRYAITISRQLNELVRLARVQGLLDVPAVRRRPAAIHGAVENVRLNALRGLGSELRDGSPGPKGSLPKWQFSEVDQEMTASWAARPRCRRNVIAERVLGLPREKRPS